MNIDIATEKELLKEALVKMLSENKPNECEIIVADNYITVGDFKIGFYKNNIEIHTCREWYCRILMTIYSRSLTIETIVGIVKSMTHLIKPYD